MYMKGKLHFSLLLVVLTTFSYFARAEPFNKSAMWEFECEVQEFPPHPAGNPTKKISKMKITWFRDSGHAKLIYPNGNGKGLREIPGFSNAGQYTAHFWMSPATSKYTGDETRNSKYGGWIESFGPAMVSIRSSGEIAITRHDIIYGGMKPFSEVGNCKIKSGSSHRG
ncbi:hypothetical protein [uncultured Pseudoteredinibacter sp.]|uniref:hypothetical protein n=1 Tax=uncultured Pseudoteredinibacter sp. TaxID=1641701 RepID=UPI002608DD7D|nr:hypothetical protein [uncultured Pseudoteredinibacter sp.]